MRNYTLERISNHDGSVLVVHDATELDYTSLESLAEELGQIGKGTKHLPRDPRLVDVVGQGASTFEFLEHEAKSGRRFVVRNGKVRKVYGGHEPVLDLDDAWPVVEWYERRWVVEEYHKAMKTGCRIEGIQFTGVERLQPAIALLSGVALTLLNLRDASRRPDASTRRAVTLFALEIRRGTQLLAVR